ncbi:hypothetical protein [Ruegeria atlantica]|uniref:hypothetical protein n=1 Tax=Ruegeria atlantica TaxID=81569 RepID=UPI00147DBB7D|nr:hypothetical protein [Ruegeria atlantica]
MAKFVKFIATASAFVAAVGPSTAQESGASDWSFSADVYFWGASINGDTTAGDEIDIGIDTLLDDFKLGFMGNLTAYNGNWSIFADLIYLDVGDNATQNGSIVGIPVELNTDVDLKGYISTFGVGYTVLKNDTTHLDIIGGGRYLELDTKLKFSLTGGGSQKYSQSDSAFDAVVGIRGYSDLNDKWYVNYYADIGAGDSDLTYQLAAGFGYRFDKFDLAFGYRYLSWDLNNFEPFDDLNFYGPYIGARFTF